MKKIKLLFLISIWAFLANAQNGFDTTDVNFLNPTLYSYTIDANGNYWFCDYLTLYKYDGNTLQDVDPGGNQLTGAFKDVWTTDTHVFLTGSSDIYAFEFESPENYETIQPDFVAHASYVDQNKYITCGSSANDPSPDYTEIKMYENGTWTTIAMLGFEPGDVTSIRRFEGEYYIAYTHGLYRAAGTTLDTLIHDKVSDLQIYNGQLYAVGNKFYRYENGSFVHWNSYSRNIGAEKLGVFDGKLWGWKYNQIILVEELKIYAYVCPLAFYGSIETFANQNGTSVSTFLVKNGLATFNPEEYIVDPASITANNQQHLNVNKVNAAYNNLNSIFWYPENNSDPAYEVPKNGGVSSFFASAFWIGGKDENNETRVAITSFLNNEQQIFPGPLKISDASTDSATATDYHRVWKIDRGVIENFKTQYENGNVTSGDFPVADIIADWPAHGPDGYAEYLAPFVDHNGDGEYNPMDGDYPEMKGDQMIYWIMNDNQAETDTANFGSNMGLEIHCTAWANVFDSAYNDSVDLINYINFLDVKIINRSNNTYTDSYVGFWSDMDLGNSEDDYVGTDVMNHSFFIYNGDDFDEDGSSSGYGEYPPAQSVTFLDAPVKNTIDGIDTGSYLCNSTYYNNVYNDYGIPDTKEDYYNYLKGKWLDGGSMTYGGTGFEGDQPCDYMFPGDSDPYNIGTNGVDMSDYGVWTEIEEGNTPGDRRGVGSNGPITIEPGQEITLRLAFVWARDYYGGYSSVDKLRELLPYVHSWQRNGEFPSTLHSDTIPNSIIDPQGPLLEVGLYPNPATGIVTLTSPVRNAQYSIYDLSGKVLASGWLHKGKNRFNTANMAKGIYLVHVTNGEMMNTKKLIVE